MPTSGFFFGILTSRIGPTDLVFGMQLTFISRSVLARLQVSVCSGYTTRMLQFLLKNVKCVHVVNMLKYTYVFQTYDVFNIYGTTVFPHCHPMLIDG